SPFLAEALEARANTLWTMGRMDDAVAAARKRQELPGAPASGWTELARMMIARNLARGQRGGKDVEEVLRQAGKAQPDALEVPLLQARMLVAQKQWKQAEQILAQLRKDNPKRVEPWAALASLAELQKEPEKARQLLDEAEQAAGDGVELRLAKARYW